MRMSSDERKYNMKVKYLKRRQIENYILDDDALFTVINKLGNNILSRKEDLVKLLFQISQNQFEQTIADYFVSKNSQNIHPPPVDVKKNQSSEDALYQAFKKKEFRLADLIKSIPQEVQKIRNKLAPNWHSDWIIYCNGRNVLREFIYAHGLGISFENIRYMVSLIWDRGQLPTDLHQILREIDAEDL